MSWLLTLLMLVFGADTFGGQFADTGGVTVSVALCDRRIRRSDRPR